MYRQEDKVKACQGQKYCQRTPVKRIQSTGISSSYCASTVREIASKIKSSAEKMFRRREVNGESILVFRSELRQISEPSKPKQVLSSSNTLTTQAIDALIRGQRMRLDKWESARAQKNLMVAVLLQSLRSTVKKGKIQQGRVNSLKAVISLKHNQIYYQQYLRINHQILDSSIGYLSTHIHQRQFKLVQIKNASTQIPMLEHKKTVQLNRQEELTQILARLDDKVILMHRQLQPAIEAMIHCMFLIGVLYEQIDITVISKKQKRWQKQSGEKGVNNSFRLSNRLAKREIVVDCKNILIAKLRATVAIYMHCKSLTISNLAALMSNLSFFSEEFKDIYAYSALKKYINGFFYGQAIAPLESTIEDRKELLKKKLIIMTKEQHIPFLRSILHPFLLRKGIYCVFLQPYHMILEVRTDVMESSQSQEDELLQFNQLKVSFTNCHPLFESHDHKLY